MPPPASPSKEILKALESAPNNYLVLSPSLYILTASDNYLEATETTREAITGRYIFEAFPDNPNVPESNGIHNVNGSLQEVLKTKKPHQLPIIKYDVPDVNNPGQFIVKYWHPSHTPVLDANGEICYIIQRADNVTDQVAKEKSLEDINAKSLDEQQALNEELTASNEEITAKNEELFASRQDLENLNEQLEQRVITRTADLEESELRTSQIIKNAPFPIGVYTGREMRIQFANQSILDIWGKGNDVIGKTYAEVLPELDSQGVYVQLDKVFTTGVPFEARNQRIDLVVNGKTQIFYFNYAFTPLRDASGTIYAVMNTAADVTDIVEVKNSLQKNEEELQAANEELASSNEELGATNEELQSANEELLLSKEELLEINTRFNIALEAGSLGAAEVDLASSDMTCDECFKKCFGKNADEDFKYHEIFEAMMLPYREKIKQLVIAAQQNHTIYKGEYEVLWPDGSTHWINAHGRARYSQDDVPVKWVVLVSDITESKLNEQRKNDFIGMVSHELKTPLTSLKGSLQLLTLKQKDKDDAFVAAMLEKANKQIGKMTKMINGFLNVSRLEAGKIYIEIERFDMKELIKEVEDEIIPANTSHTVIFSAVVTTWVNADRDKISQVMSNYVSNALKYSAPGTAIHIACTTVDGNVQVSVKDQGVGIAEKDLNKLFDRYYRVEGHQMQTVSGFGIGLYLCAEIIVRHNGKVWVESKVGEGSTFYFSIPIVD